MFSDDDIYVDIETRHDGERLGGWYEISRMPSGDELTVVFNDLHTITQPLPAGDVHAVAMRLFGVLVERHYIPRDRLPAALPEALRDAAFRYLNGIPPHDDAADMPLALPLIDAFGSAPTGSLAHRQIAWLCLNVMRSVVSAWPATLDGNSPQATLDCLAAWLRDQGSDIDWAQACEPRVPQVDGERARACRACNFDPIAEGVALCARYLRDGNAEVAAEAIANAHAARADGAWESDSVSYETWIVFTALPFALRCEAVPDALMHGRA